MMEDQDTSISRVTRSKQDAQATYDRISGVYDLLEGKWEGKPKEIALQKLRVKEGERVLEVGFGTGHGLVALAKSVGNTGKVCGIDMSEGMFKVTAARLQSAGLADRVELKHGDAERLPYEADAFDAIFSSFVLELFDTPEIPRVLSECRRVLKSGGRVGIVSLSKAGNPSRMRDLYEWGHAHFPSLLDCRPILVQRALELAGLHISDATCISLWGLPVEIVVGVKG
jgi:ubiquinone/menaquinone biosynthesis C-methylase UbiE